MVGTQATFTPKQRLIIDGAFEIAERTLDEVLRPRPDVLVLDADWTCDRAIQELAASGHSRAPVAHDRNLDDVVGMVHLRDLLDQGQRPVGEVAGEIVAFPETAGVLDILHEMQSRRLQLALVVDEHGAAAGIVIDRGPARGAGRRDLRRDRPRRRERAARARRVARAAGPVPRARPGRRRRRRHARGAVRHGRRAGARPPRPRARGAGRHRAHRGPPSSRCWPSTGGPSPRCASGPAGPRPRPRARVPRAVPTRQPRAAASPPRPAERPSPPERGGACRRRRAGGDGAP